MAGQTQNTALDPTAAAGGASDPSIVNYLASKGQASDIASRTTLAKKYGITNYTGSAEQNTLLLGKLRGAAPTGPAPIIGTQTPPTGPITSTQFEQASSAPDPAKLLATKPVNPLSDKVTAVAASTLDANRMAMDNLLKQKQELEAQQKEAEKKRTDKIEGQISDFTDNTDAQDALDAVRKKFKLDETIQNLTDIEMKIVNAQEALNMGLIYEQDRPVRQQLLIGRSSSLQKQGLATIGALQGVAAVLQGSIDLAKSYAEQTLSAISDDNTTQLSALGTLLELHDKRLVDLTDEERKTVDARIKNIQEQVDQNQKDKDAVTDLMVNYPTAFLKGGVTLLDTKATALQKMVPQMSKMEMDKYTADLALTRAQTASANRANQKAASDDPAQKNLLLQAKNAGMTYNEAILAFGDTLSIDYINSLYPTHGKTPEDIVTGNYYDQFVNPSGTIRPGYIVSIDTKTGNPIVKPDPSKRNPDGTAKNGFTITKDAQGNETIVEAPKEPGFWAKLFGQK